MPAEFMQAINAAIATADQLHAIESRGFKIRMPDDIGDLLGE